MEFDGVDWHRREWIRVYDVFQVFMLEHTLVYTCRPTSNNIKCPTSQTALVGHP